MTAAYSFNVHGHELRMDQWRSAMTIMCDTVPGLFMHPRGVHETGKVIFMLELLSCMQNGLRPYLSPAHRMALTDKFLLTH